MQQMQDVGSGLRGTEAEWKHLVTRVEAIPGYLGHARANLLAGRAGWQRARLAHGAAERH